MKSHLVSSAASRHLQATFKVPAADEAAESDGSAASIPANATGARSAAIRPAAESTEATAVAAVSAAGA